MPTLTPALKGANALIYRKRKLTQDSARFNKIGTRTSGVNLLRITTAIPHPQPFSRINISTLNKIFSGRREKIITLIQVPLSGQKIWVGERNYIPERG